jgi:PAS domain S-box-containing protein
MPKRTRAAPAPPLRKRRNEALRAEEFLRLRIAQQVVGFGMWEWELATNRVHWTAELEALYGLPPGRFHGTFDDFVAMIHPEDRPMMEKRRAEALAKGGEDTKLVFRIVRPDGAVRWIESSSIGLLDEKGRMQRLIGINLDITARKLVEITEAAEAARLGAALKSSNLIIFHQDRKLRHTWIANSTLEKAGTPVIGRTDEEIFGAKAAKPLSVVKRRVLRTGVGERMEFCVLRGSEPRCFDLIVEPERDLEGRMTGVVCAATDITERKRAESEKDEMKAKLRELAGHLQDTLEAERNAMATDIHDQVGALLTGIGMKLANLAEGMPDADPHCREGMHDLTGLVESALASTREICARLRPSVLDDLGLIESCRLYVRDWADTTGVRATMRTSARNRDPDPCRGRSLDVYRILQELLTNVARHSGSPTVKVFLSCGRSTMRLRVEDQGSGFIAGAGRGFGLTGVHERARRHNGRVDIETGPSGTLVTVTIPCED